MHTEAEKLEAATGWKKIIWRQAAKNETERLIRLHDICTRLCDGDTAAGAKLATAAIWNPA